jgi:hypothetical protein
MHAMSRDTEAKKELLYDKRTVDRSIKKGLLTRKDFDKHLKALEDIAGKGVFGGPQEVLDEPAGEPGETP